MPSETKQRTETIPSLPNGTKRAPPDQVSLAIHVCDDAQYGVLLVL